MHFRIFILGLLILCFPMVALGQTIKIEGKTMGPIGFSVIVDPLPDGVSQEEVAKRVQESLEDVNQSMSTYIADSEVSRFNKSRSTDWFELSQETATVINRALQISEETDGAFDITVGPLVSLWKFGKDKGELEIPVDRAIKEALEKIGFKNLEVRMSSPAIRKRNPNVQIDLSAIAKGYAVDQVAKTLQELGGSSYMVEVGGEVRTLGERSGGRSWQIGIELPDATDRKHNKFAKLKDASMATSGDYRNFHLVDGKMYSHTIDPKTGSPVTHQLASLSVIAADCMSADAYATAGLVLGPEKGKELFDDLGLDYFMIERSEAGFGESASENFPVFSRPDQVAKKEASVWPMFIGAAVIFGLAILGMAVGAIVNNKPITGSCGGLSAQTGETSCSLCHKPTTDCPDLKDGPTESPV